MSATILPWTQRALTLQIEVKRVTLKVVSLKCKKIFDSIGKVREVEGVLSMIMPPSSDRLWSGTPIIENFRFFLQNEQKYGKYIVQGLGSLSSRGW